MKKLFLLTALFSLILAGCTTEETKECTNPIKGVWKMQNAYYSWGDNDMVWEADEIGQQTKIWTKENFAYVNLSITEEGVKTVGGSGTYCLKGDTLTEHLEIVNDSASLGGKVMFIVMVSGDTLIQKGPIGGVAPESWGDFQLKEVYIRVE
jgi:hypothetical protein